VVRAQKNEKFKNILNSADFCLCEGKGLYFISKLIGQKLKQNINGIELIYKISKRQETRNNNQTIFLFGGTEDVVEKTAKKLGNNVVGFEHGYQDYNKVIDKINFLKPEILLVGLGCPKQEEFIYENLFKMPSVKLAIGVGGAFDFISGKTKRAPQVFQMLGFEWLWRLMVQPKRFKRIFTGVYGLICLTFKNMLFLKKKKNNN
jgi:N-acetylglucosaminyldiphosphoundecaprenol N-acetyl-beta-D-mannosaminyltransferase